MADIRLIIDENISWRLKKLLPEWMLLPVNEISPSQRINDYGIWSYAKLHQYHILTFDEDFIELQNLYNYPPKIIWLRTGNVTTSEIARLLVFHQPVLKVFLADRESGIIELQ
ncbi:DUF5615 family PIN-like protein [Mucilaginibacter koreensis]